MERPQSRKPLHTFVFINPIPLCFVSFAAERLAAPLSPEMKGPDTAGGHRIDTVLQVSLDSWERPLGAGVFDLFTALSL